jgi:hypothetical protein
MAIKTHITLAASNRTHLSFYVDYIQISCDVDEVPMACVNIGGSCEGPRRPKIHYWRPASRTLRQKTFEEVDWILAWMTVSFARMELVPVFDNGRRGITCK